MTGCTDNTIAITQECCDSPFLAYCESTGSAIVVTRGRLFEVDYTGFLGLKVAGSRVDVYLDIKKCRLRGSVVPQPAARTSDFISFKS